MTVQVRIHIVDNHGKPIDAWANLIGPDDVLIEQLRTDDFGDCVFNVPRKVKLYECRVIVMPPAGFWMASQGDLDAENEIVLQRLQVPQEPWWKACVGWDDTQSAKGI